MSKFTDFPRNTKQAYIKSCAQAAREAVARAAEVEKAYSEYTPVQNTDELLDAIDSMPLLRAADELGIDLSSWKVAA